MLSSDQLYAILANYARGRAANVTAETTLAALDLDALDMPMILLDIEDAFGIDLRIGDGFDGLATVADLAALVTDAIRARQQPRQRLVPRKKSSWMSTTARAA